MPNPILKKYGITIEPVKPTIKPRMPIETITDIATGGLSLPFTRTPLGKQAGPALKKAGELYEKVETYPRKKMFGVKDFEPTAKEVIPNIATMVIPPLTPFIKQEAEFRKSLVGEVANLATSPTYWVLQSIPVIKGLVKSGKAIQAKAEVDVVFNRLKDAAIKQGNTISQAEEKAGTLLKELLSKERTIPPEIYSKIRGEAFRKTFGIAGEAGHAMLPNKDALINKILQIAPTTEKTALSAMALPELQKIAQGLSQAPKTPIVEGEGIKDYGSETPVRIETPKLERLKGESIDQAIERVVSYQIDNGKVKLEKIADGWKATIKGIEEPKIIQAFSKQQVLNETYKFLNPDYGVVEQLSPKEGGVIISQPMAGGMKPPLPPKPTAISGEPMPDENNLSKNLNIPETSKQEVIDLSNQIKPELEQTKGKVLSHEEVVEAAKESDMLRKSISREQTLKLEAELLKTRQHLAALAQEGTITKEFIDTIKNIKAYGTTLGRQLESLKIEAEPELSTIKTKLVKHLLDLGKDTDDIVKTLEGVDFNNPQQVIDAYRKLIKPKLSEIIDEYRYINLLSSPKTHIVNTFSNILQTMLLQPMTKAVTNIKDVPKYYKGAFTSIPDAATKFIDVMRGKLQVERPDLSRIPTNTAVLKPFYAITRLLEASDVFFRTISMGGEMAAGTTPGEAVEKSLYYVFRKSLDPQNKTGQGDLLSAIDKFTASIYQLRKAPLIKWYIPFVQTPMNIAKQGIEYSPMGFATLKGAKNKPEQSAKALIGSIVFLAAAGLAMKDRTTWSLPRGKKEREAFYSAGMQPYSIKIGNKWVSFSRIGTLSVPIAMAAAIRYHTSQSVKSVSDSDLQKITKSLQGISEFFADQNYLEGLGNFLDLARGDTSASSRILLNIPTQMIPLSSLQRWVANLIDPVYRKTDRELSVQSIIENLKKGIPGLSKQLAPYTNKINQPSKRVYPVLNALIPTQVTKEMPKGAREYKFFIEQKKQKEKADNINKQTYNKKPIFNIPTNKRNPVLEKYNIAI